MKQAQNKLPTLNQKILQEGGTVSADASSILLLSKVGMLEHFAALKRCLVTQEILNEIKNLNYNVKSKHIIKNVDTLLEVKAYDTTVKLNTISKKVSRADTTVLKLHLTINTQCILTDDGTLCSYCKTNVIPYINTPMALFALLYNNRISLEKYSTVLERTYRRGRYSKGVRDYMTDILDEYRHYVR